MAVHVFQHDQALPETCRHGVVTVGNFDGVHRGHQQLMALVREQARTVSGPAVAVTFDPHPLQLLRPADFQPVLTTLAHRAELLQQHGADHVVVLHTTPELLRLEARDFFKRVLQDCLGARGLVEGPNFLFGRDRRGDIALLSELARQAKMSLSIVEAFTLAGVTVSSSRVRQELVRGDVRAAAELLGRPFRIAGTVAHGQKRGQTLGFPTANLKNVATLVPGDGVYAVRVHHQAKAWPGAANIGPNPTFGENARKIEVHLLAFKGDLYGHAVAVDFVERLRGVQAFANVDEIKQQLERDIKQARAILE